MWSRHVWSWCIDLSKTARLIITNLYVFKSDMCLRKKKRISKPNYSSEREIFAIRTLNKNGYVFPYNGTCYDMLAMHPFNFVYYLWYVSIEDTDKDVTV